MPIEPLSPEDDEWVAQLPAAIGACARHWDLAIGEPMSGGLVGHVSACTMRGEPAILKLNPPSADGFAGTLDQEAAALHAWGGRGAVELLGFAPDLRALLTRRAVPGTPLAEGSESQARRKVAGVLTKLFEASIPAGAFAPLAEAVDRHLVRKIAVGGGARTMLEPLIEQARASARLLAETASKEALLHGDLMDKNLLGHHDDLVAIDPMPHIGDPHSDIGFWAATRSPVRELEARAAELADLLDLDADRAVRWASIYAVGSACETWRRDTAELRSWVQSRRARDQLSI